MGVRILVGNGEGDSQGAVMYDSVSGWAFGPVFESYEDAEAFRESLEPKDARNMAVDELEEAHEAWEQRRRKEANAALIVEGIRRLPQR